METKWKPCKWNEKTHKYELLEEETLREIVGNLTEHEKAVKMAKENNAYYWDCELKEWINPNNPNKLSTKMKNSLEFKAIIEKI